MTAFSRRQFLTGAAAALGGRVLLAANSAQATPIWVDERRLGPFIFHATFPLAPYESLFAELPTLQRQLRAVLAVAPPREPIFIHLLSDGEQHESYVRERFPAIVYRRALFVRHANQSSIFAYQHADLVADLRHECTHALLHADVSTLPLWLDEGIAEYFELPPDARKEAGAHLADLSLSLRLGIVVDLASLEMKQNLEQLTALDYRFAWAWSHFLLHGPNAVHHELMAFLTDLRRGIPVGKFSQRLANATPDPNQQLVRHLRQLRVTA